MNNIQLLEMAKSLLNNSYAPYSNFPVAAVLLLKNGDVINGVNVENASYGGTICAERSAIVSAISQGYQAADFDKLLILSNKKTPISPCGICRQFMLEFFTEQTTIIMASKNDEMIETNIKELVPYAFAKEDLSYE